MLKINNNNNRLILSISAIKVRLISQPFLATHKTLALSVKPDHLERESSAMEGKEEDVKLGANKFPERQPIGTSAQTHKDYKEPPPAPLFEPGELTSWSFYRAGIAEFIATFLFLYITILTVMGVNRTTSKCASVGIQGIAWAFGGTIFALVYSTAGISGLFLLPSHLFSFQDFS